MGVGWQERLRFNELDPPSDGLAAMGRALVGRRVEVVEVRRLAGGVDAATHAVRFEPGGSYVVKRLRGLAAGSLVDELDRLRFARRAPVATPEPIAVDTQGAWFGHPALVMGLLPGASVIHPEVGSWIDELAKALAAVHSSGLDDQVPAVLRKPHAGIAWQPAPPEDLPRTPKVGALIEIGQSLARHPGTGERPDVLLHHDFHHRNVLWHDGHVTGVVDWNEARIGPALCDVGYCSIDLAMSHGLDATERFATAYTAATDTPIDDLHRWQCLWTANAMRWIDLWIAAFHQAGIDVSLPLARRRLDQLADHILHHL